MLKISNQYVTVFDSKLTGTDKLTHKNLSVRGNKNEDGTYENQSWNGRFIGAAKEFVDTVANGTLISVSGDVVKYYDKDKDKEFTYLLINEAAPYEAK